MIRQIIIRRKGKSILVVPCHCKFRCVRRIAFRMAEEKLPRWHIASRLGIPRKAVDRYFESVF